MKVHTRQGLACAGRDRFAFKTVAREAALHQIFCKDEQYGFTIAHGLHQRVAEFGMHIERLIGRYRPGCRGPDNHITFLRRQRRKSKSLGHTFWFGEGKADINRGIALVLIFHFCFGEG